MRNAWSAPIVVVLMFAGFYLFNMTLPIAIIYGFFIIVVVILISPFTYEFTGDDEVLNFNF
ncbi:hypothetical protein BKP35_04745 [Anaerobacillus arseniciselenatis]|uniref:Uncharacterized protein n=1 Tax=Anaerobacillus arseniciselenatis TaxID=85682 RepID=A0A1S2LSQ5_9BACI|nr:hypothetical protein [Anaerobacillus arseniciselenatis]OIJ15163.1 hypothetical protein BKP35_04745 [Anaerobacillus arseniciselenatis]